MPRLSKPLSAKQIETAQPKEKPYTLSDGQGLHLLIKPNGSKLWEYVYKSPTKFKKRKSFFNSFPMVSLKDARKLSLFEKDVLPFFKDRHMTTIEH
jgi:hypothetical protein